MKGEFQGESMSKPDYLSQDIRIWDQKLGHVSDPNAREQVWNPFQYHVTPNKDMPLRLIPKINLENRGT